MMNFSSVSNMRSAFHSCASLASVPQLDTSNVTDFYSCFYVYKYATGISAAIAIAKKILDNEEGAVENYIEMLKQGCTKKSIELLKMVDVNLESDEPYEQAMSFFDEKIKELEKLIL